MIIENIFCDSDGCEMYLEEAGFEFAQSMGWSTKDGLHYCEECTEKRKDIPSKS